MASFYTKSHVGTITRRFGLRPLKFRWIPSLYRKNAVIRIQTSTESYALKPYIRSTLLQSSTVHQMKTTADLIQLLMNNGYSYMPQWLYADSGKLWIVDKGRPFYITEWIHGRGLVESGDFEKLGRAIATLHTTSNDLLHTKKANSFTLKQIRLRKIEDRLFHRRMERAVQNNGKYRRWYKKHGKACKRLSDQLWTDMKDPEIVDLLNQEYTRPALIHGDITSTNVIVSDDGRLFIIDWDRVKIDSIYVDLARALVNTTQFNPEFIRSSLKGYEEIKPLHRAERRLITALYRLPREAWIAARFPGRKRSGQLLDMMDTTWSSRLEAIKLLDEWAHQ
ncbi:spore coat protein [Paenibacillus selenitireducens]|uniref:Spore coat protein n=1 Tax=Paenibacillus selenitireducens TaxID=1324314 RepID=A0A1T2XFZ8_9BACL|nr:phosphotransferase [Paenibacillus selenitireducens]OPA78742.1 spore coat protein [Paenibacillus selenitireducens]